jgi:hypothetical protein
MGKNLTRQKQVTCKQCCQIKSYFRPAAENYCKQNNLAFKAILVLENVPGLLAALNGLCGNVKVIFLPPNSTYLPQPMDQGVISTFEAFYL